MSIAVGQKNLGIRNPFKGLGRILLLIGAVTLACGVHIALEGRAALQADARATGYVQLGLSLLLLGIGMNLFVSGLLRSLRFYVGRNAPASLSGEFDEHDGAEKTVTGGLPVSYSVEALESMLDGKEITYPRPKTLIDRILYSLFPRLLYTPPPVRKFGESAFVPFVYALVLLGLFAVSYVIHDTSIYSFQSQNVISWMAVVYGAFIALRWFGAFNPGRIYGAKTESVRLRFRSFILAILAPVVLELIDRSPEMALPAVPTTAYLILWCALGGSLAVFALAALLFHHRIPKQPLHYGVSDERRNWEEDTHPSDLFRIFSQIMLEVRRLEIPNRCYSNRINISSGIGRNQTAEKGEFTGKVAHETQPLEKREAEADHRKSINRITSVASVLGALAVVAGVAGITLLARSVDASAMAEDFPAAAAFGSWIFGLLIVALLGKKTLLGIVQFFRSEILFDSQMILFRATGSFRTTRLTTGAGFTDSQRSESDLINSSFSIRLIASQITSSVFAVPGSSEPFQAERYVVELNKVPSLSENVLQSIRQYLRSRQKMSTFTSDEDSQVVSNFDLLNSARSDRGINLLGTRDNPRTPLPEPTGREAAQREIAEAPDEKSVN